MLSHVAHLSIMACVLRCDRGLSFSALPLMDLPRYNPFAIQTSYQEYMRRTRRRIRLDSRITLV